MIKKLRFIFFLFFLFNVTGLFAQTAIKDSLLRITKANKLDSPTVSAYLNLGKIYRVEQDSALSADSYFKGLSLAKKIDFKRGIALANIELGYLYELTEDLPKAKVFYNTAIAYAKKHQIRKELALAYSYMYYIYSFRSDFVMAKPYADSAYVIYKQLGRKLDMANQLNNIGINYWKQNKNVEAIKYYQQCLAIYDELGSSADEKRANAYNNIGLVFEALKSHDQAIAYFNKAIPLAKKIGVNKPLADAYNDLGNVYLNTKKYDKALYYYQLSLPLAKKTDQALAIGIAHANLSVTLINLKRYVEAEKFMLLSTKEYNSIQNKEGIASNLINYAQLLAETNRLNEAELSLKKAMEIAVKNKFDILKQNIFESMAEVSKLKGELTDAYVKQDSAYQLQTKNYNINTNKEIANLEVKYKTAEKEREILKNKTDLLIAGSQLQKRNSWLIITSLVVFLLVFGVFFVIRNAKLKQQKLQEESVYKISIAQAETKNQVQEEKLRISRELHDNIGAQLSFINGSIQSLAAADLANEKLQQTQLITQNTIKELRSTVWLINQQEFGLEEFVVKLREYLKPYYGSKPNIKITNLTQQDFVLEPIIATHLFRVVQEAINNAKKYADATEVSIDFSNTDHLLQLKIEDDGSGFDLSKTSQGYGLKNMASRIKTIDGTYQLNSAVGSGTKIKIEIPIKV